MEIMSQEVYNANKLLERVQLEQNGYYPSKIGRCVEKWWIHFYVIIGLIPLIGIYGTVMLIYCGYPMFKGNTILRNDGGAAIRRVPDNRYKEGYRLEIGTVSTDMVVVHPYNDEVEVNKSIGRKMVGGGIALFLFRILLMCLGSIFTK